MYFENIVLFVGEKLFYIPINSVIVQQYMCCTEPGKQLADNAGFLLLENLPADHQWPELPQHLSSFKQLVSAMLGRNPQDRPSTSEILSQLKQLTGETSNKCDECLV